MKQRCSNCQGAPALMTGNDYSAYSHTQGPYTVLISLDVAAHLRLQGNQHVTEHAVTTSRHVTCCSTHTSCSAVKAQIPGALGSISLHPSPGLHFQDMS